MHKRSAMGTSTGAYAMLTCKRIAQKRRVNAFRINGDNAASVDPAIAAQNANARYGTHAFLKGKGQALHFFVDSAGPQLLDKAGTRRQASQPMGVYRTGFKSLRHETWMPLIERIRPRASLNKRRDVNRRENA